jgi:hypothetical protein
MEAVCASKMLATFPTTTWCNNPRRELILFKREMMNSSEFDLNQFPCC